MLTKKFYKVFWLSLLAIILSTVATLSFIPSVVIKKAKTVQQLDYTNINFVAMIILEILFILLISVFLLKQLIKFLKARKQPDFVCENKRQHIAFWAVSTLIFAVLIITLLVTTIGYAVYQDSLAPLSSTIKDSEGKVTETIFSDLVVQTAQKTNNVYKYTLLAPTFVYWFIILGLLIAKITLFIIDRAHAAKVVKAE